MDESAGVGLAHRRLAVVDVTCLGHQPMVSASERYVIVYNGEVYNFTDLRKELGNSGHEFRGHSDTEVILAAIEQWGLENAVTRFVGMFVFALWDRVERKLNIVRDRLGIKPIYYGWVHDTFLFASELKALRIHPSFDSEISRSALALLVRYGYIPTPNSIYKAMHKLRPGIILQTSLASREIKELVYWSAADTARHGLANPFVGNDSEAVEHLEEVLTEAVRSRLVSDVPLGALLSGGVDSSLVVALMQEAGRQPVKTFSIGFSDKDYDEAVYAKEVARQLGTDHTELYVTEQDVRTLIPKLSTLYDEPFGDSSQIPTYLVSQLARRDVTVCLSGDGGDELFGGYDHYLRTRMLWQRLSYLPYPVRHALSKILSVVPFRTVDAGLRKLPLAAFHHGEYPSVGSKLQSFTEVLSLKSPDALFQRLVSSGIDPRGIVIDGEEALTDLVNPKWNEIFPNLDDRMLFLDLVTYLPEDILTKVDRASMGVSLEVRIPILDHRVVELAWRLPRHMKIRNGTGKWILRQVLYRHVPESIVKRPKHGFGIPIHKWMRGPLADWATELLDWSQLNDEGFFDATQVRVRWEDHSSGKRNWGSFLWIVLMFQQWLRETNSKDNHAGVL